MDDDVTEKAVMGVLGVLLVFSLVGHAVRRCRRRVGTRDEAVCRMESGQAGHQPDDEEEEVEEEEEEEEENEDLSRLAAASLGRLTKTEEEHAEEEEDKAVKREDGEHGEEEGEKEGEEKKEKGDVAEGSTFLKVFRRMSSPLVSALTRKGPAKNPRKPDRPFAMQLRKVSK